MPTNIPQRRTHAQRTDLSDRRMLEAAVQLICERGPDGTTLKDVGEQAGYSRGLAGYRFGSKPGLFEFVVRSVGERWLEQLTKVTQGKTGIAAMRAAVLAHYESCVSNNLAIRAFYMLWFASVEPESETRNVVLGIHQRRQRDVANWVVEASDNSVQQKSSELQQHAKSVAAQFSATIIGIVYYWLANPNDHDGIKALHDQLIHTMTLHMAQGNKPDD